MNQTPEFFEGPIARDYREILESATALEAAAKSSTGKDCSQPAVCPKPSTGKDCSKPLVCPKPNTGKDCSEPNVCPKAETGKDCSRPHVCKKANADAFLSVPGWSLPPAPPPA